MKAKMSMNAHAKVFLWQKNAQMFIKEKMLMKVEFLIFKAFFGKNFSSPHALLPQNQQPLLDP